MLPTVILPYNPYSHGARLMGKLLEIPVVQKNFFRDEVFRSREGATVRSEDIKQVLNWGNGVALGIPRGVKVINQTNAVGHAVNKIQFFRAMKKAGTVRVPDFTTSPKEAVEWAKEGYMVMARTLTEGKGGEGILFYEEDNLGEFLNAPLFVKFILNIAEYRMHFAFGKHIYTQKKGLPYDADRSKIDLRVRCHRAGFFFISSDITLPQDVIDQGTAANNALGLDFCALDIVYNKFYNQAWVLEANTAMGIDEGDTAAKYVEAFRENLA